MQERSKKLQSCTIDKKSWIKFFIMLAPLYEHRAKQNITCFNPAWLGDVGETGNYWLITGN